MQILTDLWHLQEYDLKIAELRKILKCLPVKRTLVALKKHIKEEMGEIKNKKKELNELNKKLRKTEREYRDLTIIEKELERKLYSGEITSIREMERLEKKLEKLKQDEGHEENITLELMDIIEKMENEITKREEGLKADIQKYKKEKLKYKKEVDKIEEELFNLELKREELVEKIDESYLSIYEQLKKNKQGVAIAKIKGGRCSGCRMSLPLIVINRAKLEDSIVKCENCGRILRWAKD
jgi:hypothetical protein